MINENQTLRNALAKASPDIAHKFEKGDFLTRKELKQLIENHLDRHVEIGAINDLEFKKGYPTGVNASFTDDNKTAGIEQEQAKNIQTSPSKNRAESKEERADKTDELKQQPKKKFTVKM